MTYDSEIKEEKLGHTLEDKLSLVNKKLWWYGAGDEYKEALNDYTTMKDAIFNNGTYTEDSHMGSFSSVQDYAKWYCEVVPKCLERLYKQGKLDNSVRRQIDQLGKSLIPIIESPSFLPIVEEKTAGYVSTNGGEVVKPYLVLPNDERYALLENDS